MSMKRTFAASILITLASLVVHAGLSSAKTTLSVQDPQSKTSAPSQSGEPSTAQKYFTDTELINQDGRKMRFYSDLLHNKVVIINPFFATCQGSCLPMSRNMEKIQEALGDRLGKDVHIISITVDPMMDTPAALKTYSARFHAKPGWYFLTGEQENVNTVLKKLGQYVEDKQNHLNLFIIGNERTGLWKKASGLAKSEELMKVVESVISDKPGN